MDLLGVVWGGCVYVGAPGWGVCVCSDVQIHEKTSNKVYVILFLVFVCLLIYCVHT